MYAGPEVRNSLAVALQTVSMERHDGIYRFWIIVTEVPAQRGFARFGIGGQVTLIEFCTVGFTNVRQQIDHLLRRDLLMQVRWHQRDLGSLQ